MKTLAAVHQWKLDRAERFRPLRAEYQSVVTCFYSGEAPLQEVDASGYRRQVYSLDRRSDADISQPPQQWDGRIEGRSASRLSRSDHAVQVEDHRVVVAPVDGDGPFGHLCEDVTARAPINP